MATKGIVKGIVSNLVTVEVDGPVSQNEICYISVGGVKLMAEVIKVIGKNAFVQVFESTRGMRVGDEAEFEGDICWRLRWDRVCCHATTMVCRTTSIRWKAFSSGVENIRSRWTMISCGISNLLPKWVTRWLLVAGWVKWTKISSLTRSWFLLPSKENIRSRA